MRMVQAILGQRKGASIYLAESIVGGSVSTNAIVLAWLDGA